MEMMIRSDQGVQDKRVHRVGNVSNAVSEMIKTLARVSIAGRDSCSVGKAPSHIHRYPRVANTDMGNSDNILALACFIHDRLQSPERNQLKASKLILRAHPNLFKLPGLLATSTRKLTSWYKRNLVHQL